MAVSPELELTPQAGSDRAWTWAATDHSGEEAWVGTLAIKFKDATSEHATHSC